MYFRLVTAMLFAFFCLVGCKSDKTEPVTAKPSVTSPNPDSNGKKAENNETKKKQSASGTPSGKKAPVSSGTPEPKKEGFSASDQLWAEKIVSLLSIFNLERMVKVDLDQQFYPIYTSIDGHLPRYFYAMTYFGENTARPLKIGGWASGSIEKAKLLKKTKLEAGDLNLTIDKEYNEGWSNKTENIEDLDWYQLLRPKFWSGWRRAGLSVGFHESTRSWLSKPFVVDWVCQNIASDVVQTVAFKTKNQRHYDFLKRSFERMVEHSKNEIISEKTQDIIAANPDYFETVYSIARGLDLVKPDPLAEKWPSIYKEIKEKGIQEADLWLLYREFSFYNRRRTEGGDKLVAAYAKCFSYLQEVVENTKPEFTLPLPERTMIEAPKSIVQPELMSGQPGASKALEDRPNVLKFANSPTCMYASDYIPKKLYNETVLIGGNSQLPNIFGPSEVLITEFISDGEHQKCLTTYSNLLSIEPHPIYNQVKTNLSLWGIEITKNSWSLSRRSIIDDGPKIEVNLVGDQTKDQIETFLSDLKQPEIATRLATFNQTVSELDQMDVNFQCVSLEKNYCDKVAQNILEYFKSDKGARYLVPGLWIIVGGNPSVLEDEKVKFYKFLGRSIILDLSDDISLKEIRTYFKGNKWVQLTAAGRKSKALEEKQIRVNCTTSRFSEQSCISFVDKINITFSEFIFSNSRITLEARKDISVAQRVSDYRIYMPIDFDPQEMRSQFEEIKANWDSWEKPADN